MNNPFDRDRSVATSSMVNNPFDSDPTHARNRFPDIAQTNSMGPSSPGLYQNHQQQAWSQPAIDPYAAQLQQQQQQQQQAAQFSPYGQQTTMGSAYPASSFNTGINPYSTPSSPFSNAGFAGGVASGGTYASSVGGTPYSHFNAGNNAYSSGLASPSYMTAATQNVPHNLSANPQLSQFDPLSPSSNTGYNQQQQQGYGSGNSNGMFQLSAQNEMDPGPITWYPRSPANPGVQIVSAFGGQTTLHIPIRPHSYTPNDHPRHVISIHRSELEQWDQYGWRQSLNALENLRIAWERMKDDIARVTDIGCPPHENAITTKMKKEASEKIDSVTAAYLQMQEVFSSYRQSPDPSSKSRVRECLNAGLRNLPEWP
ncbi:hypothetical protein M408DRAFT_328402 [Serendipita vermifera MAFF 305830]|uniref:Uncharacterized protein n=1 Tax=Serendipita vermifera MAFF 305830 TaxID=933852 RepID=A0A0C3BES8_SERVB|nr:hypothetical protein M408DRAFT_328402 [Serendipita vermifera MAFF 305830]